MKNNLNLTNRYFLVSVVLLLAYVSVFFIFGQNTYVLIHDNLDSFVPWHKTLIESGLLFENNSHEVTIMGGASRISLGNELNIMLWLNYIFDPYSAYVANQVIIRITAFIGFLLLLRRYIFGENLGNYSFIIALLFSVLPFYPNFGIGIAGLPLITYVFLNLRDNVATALDWIILITFPFYTSFPSTGLFYIIFVGFVFLYDVIKRDVSKELFTGLFIIGSLYLIINYRLFYLFIFDPDYVSHRVERVSDSYGLIRAVLISGKHFVLGHYHAHSIHWIFLPFVLIMFLFNIIAKNKDKTFVGLFALNVAISVIYGFWYYEGIALMKESYTWMNLLNLSRFSYLAPFVWYVLFAISIRYYFQKFNPSYGNKLVFVLSFLVFVSIVFKSDFANEYRKNKITYKEFYSEALFREIDLFIGKNKDEYKVVSIGIHPSIARYNGFSTLDGYLTIYPLNYKHKFRKIIEPELDKNKKLEKYYDEWGSRFYIFSSELGKNWLNTKYNNPSIAIELNTWHLYDLGGRYIFSANEILNGSDNKLRLIRTFEEKESPWKVYLYEVSNNNLKS
jgi:hypothetical protein